ELLAVGGQELGPIARELLVHPAFADPAQLDRNQDADPQSGNDRNELKHRVSVGAPVAMLLRRGSAECALCHIGPPRACSLRLSWMLRLKAALPGNFSLAAVGGETP